MTTEEILRALVQIPSYSGAEEQLADWIYQFADSQSLPVERQSDNVLIAFRSGSDRCLHFNGHMDTVFPGDLGKWSHPPHGEGAGVVQDGRLYGLGASDMKGTLASFLSLALSLNNRTLPIDVVFSFVVEEETSGRGSAEFTEYFAANHLASYRESFAVVGEPSELSFIEVGNRGTYFLCGLVEGDSSHASQRDDMGRNAPLLALKAVEAVASREPEWKERFRHPVLGEPQVTLTKFQTSEGSPNQVPDTVELAWDVRTTPGFHEETVELIQAAAGPDVQLSILCTPCHYSITDEKSTLIQQIRRVKPEMDLRIARGGNDCGEFTTRGMDAVTLGPGEKGVIHRPNESIVVGKLDEAVELYEKLVFSFAQG